MYAHVTFTGFYGQKNLGDEAFIYVLRDFFPGAKFTPGKFEGTEKHVVVGGGEFEPWMVQDAPPDANLYGIGIGLVRDAIGPERASWLRKFKYLAVRESVSYNLSFEWGITSFAGTDLVYLLQTKICKELQNKIVVVPRMNVDPWPYLERVDKSKIVFVPFHPYDLETNLNGYPVFQTEDPEEMLGAISLAQKVYCFGKLHPKIFAHRVNVPYFDFMPDVKGLSREIVDVPEKVLSFIARCRVLDLKDLLNND